MSDDTDLAVVGIARTPFGRFGGQLRAHRLGPLAALAIGGALEKSGWTAGEVTELALGVNLPGSDRSVARQAALYAGLAAESVAYTVDRACCSSLAAVTLAGRAVVDGTAEVAVAGGTENMSRVPYFLEELRFGNRLGDVQLTDQLVIACPYTGVPRAVQAADEAMTFGVDRNAQDEWALRSQARWAESSRRGVFVDEIVPVSLDPAASEGTDGGPVMSVDEAPRQDSTLDRLAALPTVYGSATVTAGNAPAMGTGSAAVVLTTAAAAKRRGVTPMATVLGTAAVSGPPEKVASVPAVAALKVLRQTGLALDAMDLLEVNEAFAAVPLVTTLALADGDRRRADSLRQRTNVNGGAIAVGHPTGASAARLVITLIHELRRRGGGHGLVTICGGIGEAHAAVLRVDPS